MSGCPARQKWTDFLAGLLDAEAEAELARHAEGCPHCIEVLDELSGSDDGPSGKRRDPGSTPVDPEPDAGVGPDAGGGGLSAPPQGSGMSAHDLRALCRLMGGREAAERPGRRTPAFPDLPGYEIQAEVARGGMGVVYRACQVKLGRTVAVKTILAAGNATRDQLLRFMIEAETLARLRHPNIVQVFEVGEHRGVAYLVMEFVDGGTLAERCAGRPVPPPLAAGLVERLARAMHQAHLQGVVHRDLKPANVLLQLPPGPPPGPGDGPGVNQLWLAAPKVTDFGLAKQLRVREALTVTGDVLGTPAYMAPEQADADPSKIGPAADTYALGVILYELLTGAPPFRGPTPLETLRRVQCDEPVTPSRVSREVPWDLSAVCLKCLEKDPARRYPSAEALADDLRRYLENRPVRARPVSRPDRLVRWCRRNPGVATLTALCLFFLAAGLTGVAWKWRDAERANAGLRQSNSELVRARKQAEGLGRDARERNAELVFHKGTELAEAGEIGLGLWWMAEGLKTAPEEMGAFRRMVRTNLAAWQELVPELVEVYPPGPGTANNDPAMSPDGRTFAISREDGTVRLYDTRTGRQAGGTLRFDQRPEPVAFHPGGDEIAVGLGVRNSSGRVVRWGLATGGPVGEPLRLASSPFRLCYSPDGGLLAALTIADQAGPCTVQVWELPGGRPLRPPLALDRRGWYLQFSPDVSLLMVTTEGGPQLYDARSLRPTGALFPPPTSLVQGFRPDGQAVLVKSPGTGGERTFRLAFHDVGSAQELGRPLLLPLELTRHNFQISASGRTVMAVVSDGSYRAWDVFTGRPVPAPAHPPAYGHPGFALQPQEGVVATCNWLVRLPRTRSRPAPPAERRSHGGLRVDPQSLRRQVCYDAAGRVALAQPGGPQNGPGMARLWDTAAGRPIGRPLEHQGNHVRGVALSADGALAATGDGAADLARGAAYVWDATTGRPRAGPLYHDNWVAALAFSPDGSLLAASDYAGMVRLWRTRDGAPFGRPIEVADIALALAFSPDGLRLAAGTVGDFGSSGHARVWDVATGRPVTGPLAHSRSDWVTRLFFTPDGGRLVTVAGRQVRVWDASTGRLLHPPAENPANDNVFAEALSPDGRLVATGDGGGVIVLWDTTTGARVGRPMPYGYGVTCLDFSPDGTLLAAGSPDGTARLWDLATHEPLGPPVAQSRAVVGVKFLADGHSFVTTAEDGATRLWPVPVPGGEDLPTFERGLQVRTGTRLENGLLIFLKSHEWEALRRLTGPAFPGGLADAAWHDARARDAEQDGDWFGARYHLTALARAEPGEWRHRLRRALAQAGLGDLEAASADLDAARAVAAVDRRAFTAGLHHAALEFRVRGLWKARGWVLDRLIDADPGDLGLLARRAATRRALGDQPGFESAWDVMLAAADNQPFLLRQGVDQIRQGDWDRAFSLYRRALTLGPFPDFSDWHQYGTLLLMRGDVGAFRNHCTNLLDWMDGRTPSAFEIGLVARVCASGPCRTEDARRAVALVQAALASATRFERAQYFAHASSIHGLQYRAGRVREAADGLTAAMKDASENEHPRNWAFLTLALRSLGRNDQAEPYRKRLEALPAVSKVSSFEQLELLVLRGEALGDDPANRSP